jgi:phosphomannomutase
VRVQDLADIPKIMTRIRQSPPTHLGEIAVASIDDFEHGFGDFPPGDILRIHLADGSRVIVRPSGTEPKVKVYLDASSTDGSPSERISAAQAMVDALTAAVNELLAR